MNEESIFAEALDRSDPADRAAFLDRACGGSPALRQDVEGLLAAYPLGQFLEVPAPLGDATFSPLPPTEQPGSQIGPYKLLEQIGEGGMGVVYMALQETPVRRTVALKIIKPGMDTRQVIARFEAERQALALMDHPHIARILDAGTTGEVRGRESGGGSQPSAGQDAHEPHSEQLAAGVRFLTAEIGRPYFVMELVRGIPITDFCLQEGLNYRQRLELFVDVCQAVQHAHQKGVIHRDIKPSNVLVTMQDGRPLVKVIDFGVAKAIGQSLTEKTLVTGFAQLLGTPLYMSPEQAALSAVDVDTRSDVYSLGVLLYELLTGTTPFDRETLAGAGYDEIRRMIREDEPLRPSARISTLQANALSTVATLGNRQPLDVHALGRLLRGELDWIVMQALEKDRNRRYQSATALSDDILRFLRDEPVEACPPSVGYRLRKYARRHQGLLTTSVLVFGVLLVGTGVSLYEAHRASSALQLADDRLAELGKKNVDLLTAQARATEHFHLARRAVDEMYTQVAEAWLGDDQELTQVQTDFLEKSLAYYLAFASDESADVDDLVASIAGIVRAGTIQEKLGRLDEAEASYQQAIARCKDLQHGHLDHAGLTLVEISAYHKLAEMRDFTRLDASRGARDAAYASFQRLNLQSAGSLLPASDQASVLSKLAGGLVVAGRKDEARIVADANLELWKSLVGRSPDDWDVRSGLAQAHSTLGVVHLWWGDANKESESAFREALGILEALLAERPLDRSLSDEYSSVLQNLAVLCLRSGRQEEELNFFRQAMEVVKRGMQDDPGNRRLARLRIDQIQSWLEDLQQGDIAANRREALPLAHEQLALARQLVERYPARLASETEYVVSLEKFIRAVLVFAGADAVAEEATQSQLATLTSLSNWSAEFKDAPGFGVSAVRALGTVAAAHIARGDYQSASQWLDALPRGMSSYPQEFPVVPGPNEDQQFFISLRQVEHYCIEAHRPVILYQDCLRLVQADQSLQEEDRRVLVDVFTRKMEHYQSISEQAAALWFRRLSERKDFNPGHVTFLCEKFLADATRNQGSPLLQRVHRQVVLFLCKEMIRHSGNLLDRFSFLVCTVGYLTAGPPELRDIDLAMQIASAGVRLRPDQEFERQQVAWVLFRQGRWHECLETLEPLTKHTDPAESDALRAMCLWQLGRQEEARMLIDEVHRQRLQEVARKLEESRNNGQAVYPTAAMLLELRREAEEMIHGAIQAPVELPPEG